MPFYLMKSLVEYNILSESDITDILSRIGDKHDYEWYEEDFMGINLLDETILPNELIIPLVEPIFEKGLNLR